MSLPNYSPTGQIMFGSVPWDNGYTNVRLYTNLSDQYSDISGRMTITSRNYKYIGRNRTLKVSIPADRLYHCNYCMYKNNSLTDGWIYCFITDVQYDNDQTTILTLETDVFQTYLYNVDWTIPACFVERETVADDSNDASLYTSEAAFSLPYKITGETHHHFNLSSIFVMSTNKFGKDSSFFDKFLNDAGENTGWYAYPVDSQMLYGVPMGAAIYQVVKPDEGRLPYAQMCSKLNDILKAASYSGATDGIIAIYTTVGELTSSTNGWRTTYSGQKDGDNLSPHSSLTLPSWGAKVDGYTPKNKKLLYYPYTYCKVTNQEGSSMDLRYEYMNNTKINILPTFLPDCQAYIWATNYNGSANNFDYGFATPCGALGSWNSQSYQNWLAQNQNSIQANRISTALMAIGGGITIAAASAGLAGAGVTLGGMGIVETAAALSGMGGSSSIASLGGSAMLAGIGATTNAAIQNIKTNAQIKDAQMQPSITRGNTSGELMWAFGKQGVFAQRMQVRAEVARNIDDYFTRFGYNVERVKSVNITSRNYFNYVKTQAAAPKSTNTGTTSSAPFSRGRGTPASALSIIRKAFDNGVTFWHTTSNFGDYSQSN